MKNLTQITTSLTLMLCFVVVMAFVSPQGATNYDYLVLGSANYGTDPNPNKDITGQNDNWISNDASGTWSLNGALTVSGTMAVTGAMTQTGALSLASGFSFSQSDTATIQNDGEDNTDTLVVPSGGSNLLVIDAADGDSITFFSGGDANKVYYLEFVTATVSIIDGGNLKLSGDLDFDNVSDRAMIIKRGTNWYLLGFVSND